GPGGGGVGRTPGAWEVAGAGGRAFSSPPAVVHPAVATFMPGDERSPSAVLAPSIRLPQQDSIRGPVGHPGDPLRRGAIPEGGVPVRQGGPGRPRVRCRPPGCPVFVNPSGLRGLRVTAGARVRRANGERDDREPGSRFEYSDVPRDRWARWLVDRGLGGNEDRRADRPLECPVGQGPIPPGRGPGPRI